MPVFQIEYDIDHLNLVIGVRAVDKLIKDAAGNSGTTRSRRYLAVGGGGSLEVGQTGPQANFTAILPGPGRRFRYVKAVHQRT